MKDSFKFDYFYGSQAEQFSFFRLPKILIRDEQFKKISSDAKILYGIMLDRMSLSRENKWMDQNNRVYIIFTLKEVMKEFECCQRKAGSLMAELDSKSGIGLIERKRQGLGRPDLIYLKNFIAVQEDISQKEEKQEQGEVLPLQSGKEMPLITGAEDSFQTGKAIPMQRGNREKLQGGADLPLQSGKNLHIQNSTEILSKSGNEAPTNNTEKNKTERNKTERNKTEDSIYPIYPTKEKGAMDVTEVYRRIVKENISYETLYSNLPIMQRRMLDEMVELMVEVLAVNRKVLRIGGTDYPYQLVKNRFLCIGQDHVEYVLHCLEQTASRIGNIKAYGKTIFSREYRRRKTLIQKIVKTRNKVFHVNAKQNGVLDGAQCGFYAIKLEWMFRYIIWLEMGFPKDKLDVVIKKEIKKFESQFPNLIY